MSVAEQRDYFRKREADARMHAERAASPAAAAAHRTMAQAYRERLRAIGSVEEE